MKAPKPLIKLVRWMAGTPDPGDDFWYEAIGSASLTGQRITPETALKLSAVFACVRLVAETIASLPLITYSRQPDGGKRRAENHFLFEVLHDQPNDEQTALEFIEIMQGHLELRGRAFAEILPGRRGFADQLVPLHPDRVERRVLLSGRRIYLYREKPGTAREIPEDQMFRLSGPLGLSPISLEAEAVGMGLAAQEYGARFFKNDARPGGVLKHPGVLKPEVAQRVRESWQEAHTGANRGKTALLEDGLEYTQLGLTNKDAQFLESRKFQAEEIARIFLVPPHKIGLLDRSSYNNIESESIDFVGRTILPRVKRWEQAIKRDLILQKGKFFAEFLVDGLLRGDTKSRYEAHAIGRQNGWLSVNDIRRMENMNPIPGGDEYLTPLNMQPAGVPAGEEEDAPPPKPNGSAKGFDAAGGGEGK